jgi:hypothetical protein
MKPTKNDMSQGPDVRATRRIRPLSVSPSLVGLSLLGLLGSMGACTGSIGSPGAGKVGGAQAASGGGSTSGSGSTGTGVGTGGSGTTPIGTVVACDGVTGRRVRRLSKREFANVVSDLLGATAATTATTTLPDEPLVAGFDNLDVDLDVSPSWQETESDLAYTLATAANPTTLAPCTTTGGSAACLQSFAQSFAQRAYGRPLSSSEVTSTMAVANTATDYATEVRLVVELVLQSPNLLYVSELGDPAAPATPAQPLPLTQYEVASQLSFFLTGSRPDTTLLSAAAANGLGATAGIQTQAQRLMALPAASTQLARFVNGWMGMTPIADTPKSPDEFPEFTDALAGAMQQEFDTFVNTQLAGGSGKVSSFFTAVSTNIPAGLAPIYGSDLTASGLNTQHRTGILSLPGLLTVQSNDTDSGPIERGLLVRRQLLCQSVPDPPASALAIINANPINTTDTTTTTRQKYEIHEQDPACSACHSDFDPIGYGFEDMDSLGRFRTTDNGLPVDSSGVLTGSDVDGPFTGPAQLSTMLANSTTAQACVVNHFLNFAEQRPTDPSDSCLLQSWTAKFSAAGAHMNDLVTTYVSDPNFVLRRDDR